MIIHQFNNHLRARRNILKEEELSKCPNSTGNQRKKIPVKPVSGNPLPIRARAQGFESRANSLV